MERELFTSHDGKELSVCYWENAGDAKAVVLISHGMSEHAERYAEFAEYLNANGYIVIADDHRGHGRTDPERLGMAEAGKDLFADTVKDMKALTDMAKEKYGLPVILFGHSYGSFLSQAYIEEYSDGIIACVLSGSALYGKLLASFGALVAGMKSKKHADEPGKFFVKITFDGYDKKIGEGKNGWLSRNAVNNSKYADDPLSGFLCSNAFYKYMFGGMKKLAKEKRVKARKDLPVFVIYGSKDYVGNCGKLTEKLVDKYVKAGLTVEVKRYEGARHELTNEINRAEVFEDVTEFFDNVVSGKWKEIISEMDEE